MRKLVPAVLAIFVVTAAHAPLAHSELSDAEKRALFLKSREDIRPVPRPGATPRPKPTPAARPTPRPTPRPVEREEPAEPAPTATPAEPEAMPRLTPVPRPQPTPKPTPTPKPPKQEKPDAPIIVEKSGKARDEGLAPAPKKSGGMFGFLGGGPKYRFLTRSIKSAIDNAKVQKGRWKYIVVHNSGTRQGNAKAFDNYHRKVRKMPNGLAYHFVIGNGTSSGDGEIEIGNRWVRQINGGHVASDYLNNIGLGICLVGDLNRDVPTKAQLAALDELMTYLRKRCGKVKGHDIMVRGHKQINPKPTDCPGDRFPLKWLSKEFAD